MTLPPDWLQVIAWSYVVLCLACAAYIAIDLFRTPQKMWIMNLVWPVTGLYFGPIAVWMYYRVLPFSQKHARDPEQRAKEEMTHMEPTGEQVSVAVFHCGAGCALGDIVGEVALFAIGGGIATFVGGSEFGTKLLVDFLLAYLFGIFFQYFTIVPMRGLSPAKGVLAAMRADTISIVAFEIGMFAWMALTRFTLFPEPRRVYPNSVLFWFMMQVAMIVGWATAYPANGWLIRKGWKEKMPKYPSQEARHRHEAPRAA